MKKKNNEVAVGIFVILGFIFLTLVLFFVSGVYLFRSGYTVNVMFNYVSILNKGAPVRMAGVRIGEVSRVDIIYDQAKQNNRVRVKLFIEKGVEIRENYAFTVRGTHVLSEPHVEISPKPGAFPLLKKGAVVEGMPLVGMEELMDQAHGTLDHIESSSASLSNILGKVEKGDGTVGKLLMEDELYREMNAFMKDVRAHPWKLLRKDSKDKRKWYFLFLA
ncbi:MAG: MlaD family protein [Candidatus Omnitrophota bacterium]